MNPKHSKTMRAFDVGGGAGDHDPLTLATAHLPQVSLTEDSSACFWGSAFGVHCRQSVLFATSVNARPWTQSIQICPNRRMLVEMGTSLAEVGPSLVESGRTSSTSWPDVGQKVGPHSANFGPSPTGSG